MKQNTGRFYLRPDDIQVIATDASKSSKFTGWGVAMDQNNELITLGARFEDKQTSFSIATLELMAFINAIPLALENGLLKPGHPLQPLINNMVTLSCVKRGSSSNQLLDSLARVSVMLLHWHNMEPYDPLYILSKLNPADIPSRLEDLGVWMTQDWVREIAKIAAPISVDLFACNLSTLVPWFFSKTLCPKSARVDALAKTWPENALLVPPFTLLTRALAKLVEENIHALAIVPLSNAPWCFVCRYVSACVGRLFMCR